MLKAGVTKFKALSTRNKVLVLGGFLVLAGIGSLLPEQDTTSTPGSASATASTSSRPHSTSTAVSPFEAANCSDRVDTWNKASDQTIDLISTTRSYASEVSKLQMKRTAEAGITAGQAILRDCGSGLGQVEAGLFRLTLDQLETFRKAIVLAH
jgi:hypothetical protein